MTTFVRPAKIADAPRLSRLAAMTFRETFDGENTPENMARYVSEAFTPERQEAEIADRAGTVLLAERRGPSDNADLVGYVHLLAGPVPAAVRGAAPLELKRLYVARTWYGQGVAQALMEAAFDAARARGTQTLWLGVWERNPRAIAFYAKYGFTRVGEHTFVLGADPQTDWVLALSLSDPLLPNRNGGAIMQLGTRRGHWYSRTAATRGRGGPVPISATPNGSLEPTGRPAIVHCSESCHGRPAAQFRR